MVCMYSAIKVLIIITNILFTELCNDHLSILRDSHSSREVITCGKDTSLQWEENDSSAPSSGTEFERLQVKFYSSRGCHNCGFFMFAFCINEAEKYNQPKCVTSMPNIGKRDTSSKDSKMVSLFCHIIIY